MTKGIITTILIGLASLLNAQTNISGTVKDQDGTPIVGGNVYLKNTYDGTSTEVDGSYAFETFEIDSAVLVISYLGYQTYEHAIILEGSDVKLDVNLKSETNALEMVVISAGAFEASDKKKAVVLRPLDIVTTAGATADIFGAINTLPGTQKVGEEGRLFVRGGAAYESRTFIDGMLVQSPYGSSVPDLPARGRFSPFLFKGTTFSTGGYSAEYGQALSAALILETQDLAPETVTGISLMSVGAGLSHTQRWDKSSISVAVDHTNLAPYVGLVDQNIEWDRPFQSWSGQLIYRHKTSETGILKFQGNGSFSDFAMMYPDFNNVEQLLPLALNNENYFGNVSFQEVLGEKWTLFTGLSYAFDQEDITQNFEVKKQEQTFQAKSTLSFQWNESLKLKFGSEWWHQAWVEEFRQDETDFYTFLNENYAAAFVEADAYLSEKLVTRVGLRTEYSALLDKVNWAPRLSVAYKTGKYNQVAMAYGRFYQNPEQSLLRYNRSVDFETSEHWMLNFQHIQDGRTFRIEGYYKSYDQLVNYDTATPWLSDNSGNGYAKGIDIFFRDRKSIKNGDYWLSYSYLDTERLYRDFPERSTPGFASNHNMSAVYKHWVPSWNLQLGATYSFSSPRPFNDPNTDGFNAEKTIPYHDLSINASYLTNLFGQFTIIHAAVSNVLGIKQEFGRRFSEQPGGNGQFTSIAIQPPAKRFFFVGMFISIGQKFKLDNNTVNQ